MGEYEENLWQLGHKLGNILYDCNLTEDQVREIASIAGEIKKLAYEQGQEDMLATVLLAVGAKTVVEKAAAFEIPVV